MLLQKLLALKIFRVITSSPKSVIIQAFNYKIFYNFKEINPYNHAYLSTYDSVNSP